LPFIDEWLEEAAPSGYFVTPLAHAQLNMVGFVIVSLSTMMVFLLPRLLGKPATFPKSGRRALAVMATGVACTYLVYFGLGLLESIQIHNGLTPDQAQLAVAGKWGRYALIIAAQGILGLGYIMLFRHISSVIGRELIRAYWARLRGRIGEALSNSARIHPRALPSSLGQARFRAILSALFEFVFLGLGWFFSGRPFIGTLMFTLGAFYLTIVYGIFALAGNLGPFLGVLIFYLAMLLFSALWSYTTYMHDATERLAEKEA
jgi:hypothetical protein